MRTHPTDNQEAARAAVDRAWPIIRDECRSVLGSELHYQAMVYYALRTAGGVPLDQLGMNVKQEILEVRTALFQKFDMAKHEAFRGGFEPIPDVVIFSPEVGGDWRRRRASETIKHMLVVIEVKASERRDSRLSRREVVGDIEKLAAHREEAGHLGHDFHPIMMVLDTATTPAERMSEWALVEAQSVATNLGVEFRYLSPDEEIVTRPSTVPARAEPGYGAEG